MGTEGWRICGANRQNGKGPCGAPATQGSNRCRLHGGAAHKLARARKVAIEKLERAAANYGYAVEVDPSDALQQEIDRTNGLVIFLGSRLRNAGAGDLVEAIGTETKDGNLEKYQITKVEPIIGPWVQLYLKERQHLLALTRTALSVGLEERRMDENRRMDAALEILVMTLLTALGHDPYDERVRRAVASAAHESDLAYQQSAMTLTGEIVPLHKKRGA